MSKSKNESLSFSAVYSTGLCIKLTDLCDCNFTIHTAFFMMLLVNFINFTFHMDKIEVTVMHYLNC